MDHVFPAANGAIELHENGRYVGHGGRGGKRRLLHQQGFECSSTTGSRTGLHTSGGPARRGVMTIRALHMRAQGPYGSRPSRHRAHSAQGAGPGVSRRERSVPIPLESRVRSPERIGHGIGSTQDGCVVGEF